MSELNRTEDDIEHAIEDVKSMAEMQKAFADQQKTFNEKFDEFMKQQANLNKALIRGNEEEREEGKHYGFLQAKKEVAKGKTALAPYWDEKTEGRFNDYIHMVYEKDYKGIQKAFGDNVQDGVSNWTPTEFRSEIIRMAYLASYVLPKATVIPMGRDKVQMPKPSGSYTVDWVDKGSAMTDSKVTLGQLELDTAKLGGLAIVNREDLDDSAIPLAQFIASQMGEDFGLKIDEQAFQGTIDGGDPFNGLEYFSGLQSVAGAEDATPTFAELLTEANLLDAVGKLDDRQVVGAEWHMTNQAWNAIRAIEDGASSKIVRLNENYVYDLLGFPVNRRAQVAPATATASRVAAYFGNLRWLYIGDRMDFRIDTSEHYRFANDQVVFRGTQRLAIKPALPANFVKLVFGAEPSGT